MSLLSILPGWFQETKEGKRLVAERTAARLEERKQLVTQRHQTQADADKALKARAEQVARLRVPCREARAEYERCANAVNLALHSELSAQSEWAYRIGGIESRLIETASPILHQFDRGLRLYRDVVRNSSKAPAGMMASAPSYSVVTHEDDAGPARDRHWDSLRMVAQATQPGRDLDRAVFEAFPKVRALMLQPLTERQAQAAVDELVAEINELAAKADVRPLVLSDDVSASMTLEDAR